MRFVSIAFVFASVLASVSAQQPVASVRNVAFGATRAAAVDTPSTVVSTYCATCHNGVMRSISGGLLERFDGAAIGDNRDAWARAYHQIQAGTMPPFGAPRPDGPGADMLLASIETSLGTGAPRRVDATSAEIAERLASLLWNSAPDAALREEAQRNRLTVRATLEQQIQRMLADDRAEAFVSRFFFPWLGLDQLGTRDPDPTYFPGFDVALRDAMATETDLFLRSQLRENRDPLELWTASYTFVNEPLARHYGLMGVTGSEFRRVLSSPERAGLLGQGSIQMITSRHGKDARFTSPAARAIWIRQHYLGANAPNPAPNVPPIKPDLPITPQTRQLPAEPCVNCHRNFFPLGYALENFDTIGRWRTQDQAGPVDASGTFVDGSPTNGIVQLRTVLLQHPDAFRTTMAEKLLAYAAGEPVNKSRTSGDTLVRARQLLRESQSNRWSSLIAALVGVRS
jgi:hypothetical protein